MALQYNDDNGKEYSGLVGVRAKPSANTLYRKKPSRRK